MYTTKFYQLTGEQKIDACDKIASMGFNEGRADGEDVAKQIEDGYDIDADFFFEIENENIDEVVVTARATWPA